MHVVSYYLHPMGVFEATLVDSPEITFSADMPNQVSKPHYLFDLKTSQGPLVMIIGIDHANREFFEDNQPCSLIPGKSKILVDVHHALIENEVRSYPIRRGGWSAEFVEVE